MALTLHASVEEFFRGVLDEALQEQGVSVSPTTEYYLVGLLGDLASSRMPDQALALKLAGAKEQGERVKALKEIGDTSLVVSGLFAKSVKRSLVQVDYYIDMGKAAYSELSNRLQSSTVSGVYSELAAKFPAFVSVLGQVRRQVAVGENDMVALYEEWQRTRADWIEKKLKGLGMIVGEGNGTLQ